MKSPLVLIIALCVSIVTSSALDQEQFMPIAKGMMTFPDAPTEASFRQIEQLMDALPKIQDEEDRKHINAICASFLAAAHTKHGYAFQGSGVFTNAAKEIVSGKGKFAEYILDDADVDTSKFDVRWMSYLGSQDDEYLRKLLKWAGSSQSKDDPVRSAFIQTANWSFKSNCQQISGVKEFAKKSLNDPRYRDKSAFLKTCIDGK